MKKLNEMRALNLKVILDETVCCKSCGQMLAYIMPECKNGTLHLICKCGNSGYMDWGKKPEEDAIYEAVDMENRVISCPVCHNKLIEIGENTSASGFKISCSCGHNFDKIYESKRRLYSE